MYNQNTDDETLSSFRRVTMELENVYSLFAKACMLSEAEYWSLLLIYEGFETQSEISDQLFLNRQTLNSAFKQLRKKGLIRLEPYEENQRSKQAILTEEGKKFVASYVIRMRQAEASAWKQLSPEGKKQLTDLTQKYKDFLQQELNTVFDTKE